MMKLRRKWFYYSFVLVAWASYIALSVAAPSNNNQQVQFNKFVILTLTVTLFVPYLLTWLVAVLGLYHFRRFAQVARSKHFPNSSAFQLISYGLALLILDLVTVPFLSSARNIWSTSHHAVVALTIVSNYTHILLTLMGIVFLFIGSRVLAQSSNYATGVKSRALPAMVAATIFSLIFSIAVFSNPSRQVSTQDGVFATYYLSDSLIFLTIIVPLAVTWFLGLQTAINTERYVHSLSRPMWREAILRYFYGLLAILSSTIILQGLTMVGNQQLQKVSLILIICLVYLFILLQAAGYLFIRSSAKHLRTLIEARGEQ